MAPEMIDRMTYHGPSVDWWALGCIIFQMLTGKTPFGDITEESKYSIYMRIRSGKVSFPRAVSGDAKDLIKGLLTVEIKDRFKWEDVARHPWFSDINWSAMRNPNGKVSPPWVPTWDAEGDSQWFPSVPTDKEDTSKFHPSNDEESDMAYLIASLKRPKPHENVVSMASMAGPSPGRQPRVSSGSTGRRPGQRKMSHRPAAAADPNIPDMRSEKWKTLQQSRKDVVARIRSKSSKSRNVGMENLKNISASRRMLRQGSRKNVYT